MPELPKRLYVANRGEIARRIILTAHALGVETVVGYSAADAELPFVAAATRAIPVDSESQLAAYLDSHAIIARALAEGCDSVHPGYGFLSEDPIFARMVVEAGLRWVGPSPEIISLMGDKIAARRFAASVGVPVGSGSIRPIKDTEDALAEAATIGYPVMIKASAGGGGIGMARADTPEVLESAVASTQARAGRSFASSEVYLERYIASARHIEVQVLGLADGSIAVLGDRDCSVQRRHQKIVEEAPAVNMDAQLRQKLHQAARDLAENAGYRNAGTVEFLVDNDRGDFVFLEMNTRLQVEHRVTELVTGIDIVAEQLRIASMMAPGFDPEYIISSGHAIEIRVYAEDPVRFYPSPGVLTELTEPSGDGVFVDAAYVVGNEVTVNYDPMIAKLYVYGESRKEAIERAVTAVDDYRIRGVKTNLPLVTWLLQAPEFVANEYDTGLVEQVLKTKKLAESGKTRV